MNGCPVGQQFRVNSPSKAPPSPEGWGWSNTLIGALNVGDTMRYMHLQVKHNILRGVCTRVLHDRVTTARASHVTTVVSIKAVYSPAKSFSTRIVTDKNKFV